MIRKNPISNGYQFYTGVPGKEWSEGNYTEQSAIMAAEQYKDFATIMGEETGQIRFNAASQGYQFWDGRWIGCFKTLYDAKKYVEDNRIGPKYSEFQQFFEMSAKGI